MRPDLHPAPVRRAAQSPDELEEHLVADIGAQRDDVARAAAKREALKKRHDEAIPGSVERQDLKAKLDAASANADRLSGELVAKKTDLEALRSPATDDATRDRIHARHRAAMERGPVTTTERRKGIADKGVEHHRSTATHQHTDGVASSDTASETTRVDGDGLSHTSSRSRSETGASGTSSVTASQKTQIGKDGFQHTREDTWQGAGGDSKSHSESTSLSGKGASRKTTDTESKADGSSTTRERTRGVERGGGRAGRTSTDKNTTISTDKTETSVEKSRKAGVIAGQDGLGAFAEGERKSDRKYDDGMKVGTSFGVNGSLKYNVVKVDDSDGYAITMTLNLGARAGGSAGLEKEGRPGGTASATGSIDVIMAARKVLPAQDAKAYVDQIKAANGGSAAGGDRELAIIATAVNQGIPAARRMYLGLQGTLTDDPTALTESMQDGDRYDLSRKTTVEGKAEISGGDFGANAGASHTSDSTFSVEKKDGKLEFTRGEGEGNSLSAGGKGGFGKASMGLSRTWSERSGITYVIVIDPKAPDAAELQKELAGCGSQEELAAFAKTYPHLVSQSIAKTGHGTETTTDVTIAGPGGMRASATLTSAADHDEEVTRDKDGRVIEDKATGSNKGGLAVNVGGLGVESSSTEQAAARTDADGNSSLDLSQTDTETDADKFLAAHVPFADTDKDPAKNQGVLSRVTGGDKPKDTSTTNVSGIAMSHGDLAYLGSIASDEKRWMRAVQVRHRKEWAATRIAVLKAGGDPAAVAKALARFVGNEGHGRDDIVYGTLRGPGGVSGGKKYEFPDGMADRKATFMKLVASDPLVPIDKVMEANGIDEAKALAASTLRELQSLHNQINTVKNEFENGATWGEMLSSINERINQVRQRVAELEAGGMSLPPSKTLLREEYNGYLSNCINFQFQERDFFAEIDKLHDGDRITDPVAKGEILFKVRTLHASWDKEYGKMATLAQEHGFGEDRYWKYKPDKARFARAQAGRPGEASEASPETRDFGPGPAVKRASGDPVGDSMRALEKKQKEQASGIKAALRSATNKAMGRGNRLHAWIQRDRKPQAIHQHNLGMERLRSAQKDAAKIRSGSVEDLESYGAFAVQDFNRAADLFQQGLALYPPGWPPRG